METLKQSKEYCSSCKQDLCHGERALLTRDLKFFHFYCYKKKSCIFRFFNPIKSYFIWQEASVVLAELNEHLKNNEDQNTKSEDILAGGDNAELHELAIVTKVDVEKTGSSIDEDEGNSGKSSQIVMDELTDNLMQIMEEVGEMKNKINIFSVEKENDEKTIKYLEQLIAKNKREIMELKWENSYLREKLLTTDSNKSEKS